MYNLYNEQQFKKMLPEEEQNELLNLAQQGDYKAQQKLFEHNLRLVLSIINRNFPDIDYDLKEELFQVGCMGLWEAIRKYSSSYHNTFSTYAHPTILGEIKNHFRDNNLIWVPMKIQKNLYKIKKLQLEYKKLGKDLTSYEISELLNIPFEEVEEALNSNKPLTSLNKPVDKDRDKLTLENIIEDKSSGFESLLEKKEFKEKFLNLINTLDEEEQFVIKASFGIGCKIKVQNEIAEMLNLSRKQIVWLKSRALYKLKKQILQNEYLKEEAQIEERVKKERKNSTLKPKTSQMLFEQFPKYTEEQILEAVKYLNNQNKKIIELSYGLNGNISTSYEKIADMIDIKYENVRSRIHVIKKQINKILELGPINIRNQKTPQDLYKLFPSYSKEKVLETLEFLNNENKQIIELKYGLNGNVSTYDEEIAKILNISKTNVRRRIYTIKKQINKILENGPRKKQTSKQKSNIVKKEENIFAIYSEYTNKEVLEAIDKLDDKNKKIIELKYGLNGNEYTKPKDIAKEFNTNVNNIYQILRSTKRKITKILIKQSLKKIKLQEENALKTQYNKTLQQNFFDTYKGYTKEQVLGVIDTLSVENKKIITMKYGLNDNDYYWEEEIAKELNLPIQEVKKNINLIKSQIRRRLEKGYFKRETIFDIYNGYTKEQILGAINTLNRENKRIVELKYGLNGNDYTETKDIAKEFNTTVAIINSRFWTINEQINRRLKNNKFERETIFDIYNGYTKEQVLGAISTLDNKEKRIMELKYGLNGNEYTETKDIAKEFNVSSRDMCFKIDSFKRKIERRLENGQFERETIFTLFNEYTKEQVLQAIDTLNLENKRIIELRYGIHNNQPMSSGEIEKKYNVHRASARIYSITTQIEKRLKKINRKNRENIKKLINSLDNPLEQIILTLRLGYINNKYYTSTEIAKILNTNEEFVTNSIIQGFVNIIDITNNKTGYSKNTKKSVTKTIK